MHSTCYSCHGSNLGTDGTSDIDSIIANVLASARGLFPQQTAEAEAWISQRLMAYGIDYAKYKAQQAYGTLSDWLSSPVVLLGLGFFAAYILLKR